MCQCMYVSTDMYHIYVYAPIHNGNIIRAGQICVQPHICALHTEYTHACLHAISHVPAIQCGVCVCLTALSTCIGFTPPYIYIYMHTHTSPALHILYLHISYILCSANLRGARG
jgi:hypothetical protein